jgi:hypothetical protein
MKRVNRMPLLSTAGLVVSACLLLSVPRAQAQVVPWFNNKPQVPDRITVFWTDTVLNQPGQRGVRGFGARMMFFNSNQDKPVKVDGTLTVFAYDDTDGDLSKTVPDRKFIFTPDQLPKHYGKSKIGHSYSFWVPWDAVGGEQRIITLVCRFEPLEGGLVVSEALKQVLPGRAPLVKSKPAQNHLSQTQIIDNRTPTPHDLAQQPVRQASFAAHPETRPTDAKPRLQTSTITLPPNYHWRHLEANRFAEPRQAAWMQVEQATPLAQAPSAYDVPEAPSREHVPPAASAAGPDPQVVAAAAELLAKALAQQAYQTAGPPTGSPPPRSRALGEPIPQPRSDRVQMRPHPKGWPADLPPRPGSTGQDGRSVYAPTANADALQPQWTPAAP